MILSLPYTELTIINTPQEKNFQAAIARTVLCDFKTADGTVIHILMRTLFKREVYNMRLK
jgi:hypothetical protein